MSVRSSYRLAGGQCVFCDIVDGLSPATVVQTTGNSIAIVPLGPVVAGHLLFIPHRHVENAAEDPWITGQVMLDAAAYANRAGGEFNLITSAGRAATQTVFHLHIHYVPRSPGDQLEIPWGTVMGEGHDPHRHHECSGMRKLRTQLSDAHYAIQALSNRPGKD
jgi:histidine triad (HIT) family protein